MSQFIKFYFTSSMLNMFRTLIHPSSGACDFSIVPPHWLCVLVSMCVGVSVRLVGVVSVWQAEAQLQPATRIRHDAVQSEEVCVGVRQKFVLPFSDYKKTLKVQIIFLRILATFLPGNRISHPLRQVTI